MGTQEVGQVLPNTKRKGDLSALSPNFVWFATGHRSTI